MSKKSEKAATKRNTKKTEAAPESKAAMPKREKAPKEELCVFALRLREDERAKIHETAGPRLAALFSRRVLVAFANEDPAAFKAVLDDARQQRQ